MSSEKLIKILTIEDDLEHAKSLADSLAGVKSFDFSIDCVTCLAEAVQLIRDKKFDVVLLDLFLQQCQGLLTLKKLRACDSDLPIVILTNHEDVELAINAVRYGAQDYLIKSQITSHFLSLAIRYAVERKKTEKFHREQLHFLQSVMDNIPNPLFMKDTDLVFSACNIAFEKVFGVSKNKIIGRTVFEVFDGESSEVIREKELEILSGARRTQVYEVSFKGKDRKAIEVFFHEAAHKRANGELGGLIGVATDISKLKEAEFSLKDAKLQLENKVNERTKELIDANEQLKKQIEKRKNLEKLLARERKIFMNGPVVVFRCQVKDDKFPVEYMSPNINQFGYEYEDFVSGKMRYCDIIDSQYKDNVINEIKKFSRTDTEHLEQSYSIITANGELRRIHSSINIGRNTDKKVTHFDGYIVDITDWK